MRTLPLVVALLLLPSLARGENWPGWRGPRGDGTSLEGGVPTEWSATENVRWKTPLPGAGHASPIVWEDRVFVVAAIEESAQRVLVCLDRATGSPLWQRTVLEAPLEGKHSLNSYASSTPATDGARVYAAFLDQESMFVAAYDFDGREVWSARPGAFSSRHGFCSCPVLFEDKVIVNGDHDGQAYLVALHRDTGDVVWKIPRPNNTRSYVTPIIREIDGRTQMILSGNKCVASYDPRDGSQHWLLDGPTEQFVASIVYNGRLLFMTCGYPEHHLLAIRPDGRGNVTETHVAWRTTQGASYVPSPIATDEHFLVVSDDGIASCFAADSGERLWMERLGTHFSASLVSAGGLVYFLDDDGRTTVVRPGEELDVVAENELGEACYASPAISDGAIYVRGEKSLWAIGN